MKITHKQLRRIIKEEITRIVEGDVIDLFSPELPWVHSPEGYTSRAELDMQRSNRQDIGADSPPEVMVARALAYRASELTNYKQEFDDEIFSDYAMRIYQDYVLGKSGDKFQALDSMLNRIDDGGWDDEEIMDIAMGEQMATTQDRASQQDPDEIADMDLDFERYLQGIESGDVVELEQDDD